MFSVQRLILVGTLFLAVSWSQSLPAGENQSDADALRAAGLPSDGPGLLQEFRKRTSNDVDPNKIPGLIQQLGDDSFPVRERASAQLLAYGRIAVPLLRKAAAESKDLEIVRRAETCVLRILADADGFPAGAALRTIARSKPVGAAEVLLAYLPFFAPKVAPLPFAPNEDPVGEVQRTLAQVAVRDGKPEAVLVGALADHRAWRRAAAAEALAAAGAAKSCPTVYQLLQDPDPARRLCLARALTFHADKEAVPALIGLLDELPTDAGWQAEELLYRLAGDQAPRASPGPRAANKRKCRDTWAAWWRAQGPGWPLPKIDPPPRLLGYTMCTSWEPDGKHWFVSENGPNWSWAILSTHKVLYPVDAHVVADNRVLIAEYEGKRVTERAFRGEVHWQVDLASPPVNVQRLANGNTFVATHEKMLELDPKGKEVLACNPTGSTIQAGARRANGQMVLVTDTGLCLWLDRTGKELKRCQVGVIPIGGLDVLANGRVLLAHKDQDRVAEYDDEGNAVWEATVSSPMSATRLPNGNTLVASYDLGKRIELDRAGKKLWSWQGCWNAVRARRR